jgi:hypothetical protein
VVNFAHESYAHEGCLVTMHKFVILWKSSDTQELSWSVEMKDKFHSKKHYVNAYFGIVQSSIDFFHGSCIFWDDAHPKRKKVWLWRSPQLINKLWPKYLCKNSTWQ